MAIKNMITPPLPPQYAKHAKALVSHLEASGQRHKSAGWPQKNRLWDQCSKIHSIFLPYLLTRVVFQDHVQVCCLWHVRSRRRHILLAREGFRNCSYSPSCWDLLRNMVPARGWSDGLCAILDSGNTKRSWLVDWLILQHWPGATVLYSSLNDVRPCRCRSINRSLCEREVK